MAELVAAGEIPLAATIYNHNVERLHGERRADQVEGARPDVRPAERDGGGEAHRAAACRDAVRRFHALAGRAELILKERNRVPASTAVQTNLNKFPFLMIDPV